MQAVSGHDERVGDVGAGDDPNPGGVGHTDEPCDTLEFDGRGGQVVGAVVTGDVDLIPAGGDPGMERLAPSRPANLWIEPSEQHRTGHGEGRHHPDP